MKRIFHHYHLWEDVKNGMYRDIEKSEQDFYLNESAKLLSDHEELKKYMYLVVQDWKYSTQNNLTDKTQNRKAWLGQAACCYKCSSPEDVTREAWWLLTKEEQINANNVAKEVILYFEREVYGGAQKLFRL